VNPIQTQHPFGDPAATQYHRDGDMLAELRRRATIPSPVHGPGPLAPVAGEISTPARVSLWTALALVLYAAVMGAALILAIAL
jgi:hypothetical protein